MWFKDVLKWHMKKTGISHDTWEEAAQRVKWRGLLRKATSAVEEQCQHNLRNSDNTLLLNSPFKSRITLGDRSFKYAGPKLWNELLRDVRYANTVHSFKVFSKLTCLRKLFCLECYRSNVMIVKILTIVKTVMITNTLVLVISGL